MFRKSLYPRSSLDLTKTEKLLKAWLSFIHCFFRVERRRPITSHLKSRLWVKSYENKSYKNLSKLKIALFARTLPNSNVLLWTSTSLCYVMVETKEGSSATCTLNLWSLDTDSYHSILKNYFRFYSLGWRSIATKVIDTKMICTRHVYSFPSLQDDVASNNWSGAIKCIVLISILKRSFFSKSVLEARVFLGKFKYSTLKS